MRQESVKAGYCFYRRPFLYLCVCCAHFRTLRSLQLALRYLSQAGRSC